MGGFTAGSAVKGCFRGGTGHLSGTSLMPGLFPTALLLLCWVQGCHKGDGAHGSCPVGLAFPWPGEQRWMEPAGTGRSGAVPGLCRGPAAGSCGVGGTGGHLSSGSNPSAWPIYIYVCGPTRERGPSQAGAGAGCHLLCRAGVTQLRCQTGIRLPNYPAPVRAWDSSSSSAWGTRGRYGHSPS